MFEIYLVFTKHNANIMHGMYNIKTTIYQIRFLYIRASYLITQILKSALYAGF
jgi:hypothetical protein